MPSRYRNDTPERKHRREMHRHRAVAWSGMLARDLAPTIRTGGDVDGLVCRIAEKTALACLMSYLVEHPVNQFTDLEIERLKYARAGLRRHRAAMSRLEREAA
jgi:hypothetical protein